MAGDQQFLARPRPRGARVHQPQRADEFGVGIERHLDARLGGAGQASQLGMPDGEYRLGEHTVQKCLGGVRLADGTLAGSALTMDQALRNLVQTLGLSLPDAARRVSTAAAEYLGLADRGRLAAGAWADVVVMDAALNLRRVFVEGEEIDVVADA